MEILRPQDLSYPGKDRAAEGKKIIVIVMILCVVKEAVKQSWILSLTFRIECDEWFATL